MALVTKAHVEVINLKGTIKKNTNNTLKLLWLKHKIKIKKLW
jgi:hypothetical protein